MLSFIQCNGALSSPFHTFCLGHTIIDVCFFKMKTGFNFKFKSILENEIYIFQTLMMALSIFAIVVKISNLVFWKFCIIYSYSRYINFSSSSMQTTYTLKLYHVKFVLRLYLPVTAIG